MASGPAVSGHCPVNSDQWAVGVAADNESLIEVADDLSSAPRYKATSTGRFRSTRFPIISAVALLRRLHVYVCVCVWLVWGMQQVKANYRKLIGGEVHQQFSYW